MSRRQFAGHLGKAAAAVALLGTIEMGGWTAAGLPATLPDGETTPTYPSATGLLMAAKGNQGILMLNGMTKTLPASFTVSSGVPAVNNSASVTSTAQALQITAQ